MTDADKRFDEWCIVEVMGHQMYAGRVTEQAVGGASFIRIDVPAMNSNSAFTKLFGPSSIYCMTPCSQEVALAVAKRRGPHPVNQFCLPGTTAGYYDDEEGDDDDDVPY